MKKHLQYLKYVVRHKWYVMWACFGEGLYWRGITHDTSKFRPSEFLPYANFFYGKKQKDIRDKTGYYKPTDTGDAAFDFAWLLHQKRNRHHWQWWVLPEDEGGVKVLEMSNKFVTEMLCDWMGAGRAQNVETSTYDWWKVNNHKMQLHRHTRTYIEWRLKEPKFTTPRNK